MSSERVIGQVKWFNTKAGYGFITGSDGEHKEHDIFVHFSSIKVVNSQYRYLVQGEYVEFDVVKPEGDKHEHHAVNVTGINGGSIMCESRRANTNGDRERERPYPNAGRRIRRYHTQPPSSGDGPGANANTYDSNADAITTSVAPSSESKERRRPLPTSSSPPSGEKDGGFKPVVKRRPRSKTTASTGAV